MAVPTTTIASKKYQVTTTKYQTIHISCFKIYTEKDLCWSLFLIKFQVFSLQLNKKRLRHRRFPVKLLWTRFFIEHLGHLLLEEHKILLKPVPIAIPNYITKSYYQDGFVICFLRSTYRRFMEFLIETYNRRFSCSWIFSAYWALPNA